MQSAGAGGVRVCRGPVCRREIGGHLPPQLIKTGGGRDGSELSLSLCQREGEKKTQARKKAKRRRSRWRKSSQRNPETAPVSPRKTPKGLREGKILVLLGGLHHPAVFWGGKGDFENSPHPINKRRKVDLSLLCPQDLCFGFKGVLQWLVMVIICFLSTRNDLAQETWVRNSTVPAYTLI